MEKCAKGAENAAKIAGLERTINDHNAAIHARAGRLEEAIVDIRDRLLGRPTWIVTFLLAISWSVTTGVLIAVIREVLKK